MTNFTFAHKVKVSLILTAALLVLSAFVLTPPLFAAEAQSAPTTDWTKAVICISAAAAFGLGAMGAGMAISKVGAAAMGAISERPEIATNALIFIALAEGLVVFGFITAIMILGKV
jgi:V/A-type H+/Na+-transporting ATPase subunit K